jgi:hypothetical protein
MRRTAAATPRCKRTRGQKQSVSRPSRDANGHFGCRAAGDALTLIGVAYLVRRTDCSVVRSMIMITSRAHV